MHRGYLALWRKLEDHPFWKEKREFSKAEAWIDILWQVQHSEKPQEILLGMTCIICNYGESLKSLDTWAKRWRWNKSRVRRFLHLLENMKQIRHTSEKKTTRITVLNYKQYDPRRNAIETQLKRKRNDSETIATPDKKVKKVKKVIKPQEYSTNFLFFWKEYPKKTGKKTAFESWQKYNCENGLFDAIIESLVKQKESDDWQKDGGKYVPMPATWINGMRWEDELLTTSPQKSCDNCTYKIIDKMNCWQEGRKDCGSFTQVNK